VTDRRRLQLDLENALVALDTDGLRFVLCIAIIRGLDIGELNRLGERLVKKEEPK
jgi:hypothetical protein